MHKINSLKLMVLFLFILVGEVRGVERQLLWGDTHLHTSYSIDAYLMGNKDATPDTAYRFAKGLPVVHPYSGVKVQTNTPLDFLVVSDHGEYLGIIQKVFAGDPLLMQTEIGRRWNQLANSGKGRQVYFEALGEHANKRKPSPELQQEDVRASVWSEIVDAAERHYQPGSFTTFVGWEWSSITDGANLHRVVISDADKSSAKAFLPYTLFDSDKPEDLWQWLEQTSARTGVDFVAIPHNSNISKGLMFPITDSNGSPIDIGYAKTRMRWEPVVEVTQIKGDSETHPSLSPNDEFSGYEKYEQAMQVGVQGPVKEEDTKANYVRSALRRGIELQEELGVNPYKVGMIGASDSHTALSTVEEDNFWGKMAIDSTPANTLDPSKIIIPPHSTGMDMSAAGIAGVWAEENTRESIIAAFKRKEVYATTGPRIRLRVFAGYQFTAQDASHPDLARIGYVKGEPMGSDLPIAPDGQAPMLLIEAVKDPQGAALDRVQVIKGWVDSQGHSHEKIFDVVWSGDRKINASGKVPKIESTVNLTTLNYDNRSGSSRLASVWQDPEFKPEQQAFYYVRVLEIPTPRHTLYDAVALNVKHPKHYPTTIQERAYSSPIWYTPLNKEK
ncbi:DUF3604 domain-containing protein [Pseudoalteromonas piscicida]|uniref:DUF3604 domain-containing protein n=1 Tax=Pseudoalteromonas piscicida TaxID=43662 RepID=A0AAD0RT13_PSEO7|nr:DUF3604 domain-containing protein [Pseudoalteromonas piscicida]AXR04118.1 DUF3604 domain-containing protein [Pseudoalteromonas piscicida]